MEIGFESVVTMQLGNISWRFGGDLKVDPSNSRIIGDKDDQKLWSREYETSWEPKV